MTWVNTRGSSIETLRGHDACVREAYTTFAELHCTGESVGNCPQYQILKNEVYGKVNELSDWSPYLKPLGLPTFETPQEVKTI